MKEREKTVNAEVKASRKSADFSPTLEGISCILGVCSAQCRPAAPRGPPAPPSGFSLFLLA